MLTAEALRHCSLEDFDESCEYATRQYLMEARISVLTEHPDTPWKILSVRVGCVPKTGESDHQLQMNRKQMFDLNWIGERAMVVEEAIWKNSREHLERQRRETLERM